MPTTSARLRILVLAFAYAAGNFGLPVADLLLKHRLGAQQEERVHFESQDGSRDHGGHCPLNRLLADLRTTEAATPETPSQTAQARQTPRPTPEIHPSVRHEPPYRSRAPPSFG